MNPQPAATIPDSGVFAPSSFPTASRLVDVLGRRIVSQDEAKATLTVALLWFLEQARLLSFPTNSPPAGRNVFLSGPTGCGKTTLVREAAQVLDLPLVQPDLSEYLVGGGHDSGTKNVNDMVSLLLREIKSNTLPPGPLGIVLIEGAEHLAMNERETAASKERLQMAIARLADGKRLNLVFGGKLVTFDSQKILFLLSANSEVLEPIIKKRRGATDLGFRPGPVRHHGAQEADSGDMAFATTEDLVESGFSRSVLTAFPIRASLHRLTESDLLRICQLQDSPIDVFRQTFAAFGVVLDIDSRALPGIAKAAASHGIGGKGIGLVLHQLLDPVMMIIATATISVQKVILRSLDHAPEIVHGPPSLAIRPPCPATSVSHELPETLRSLFPNGLPRRPARPNASQSATRWATRKDLSAWLTPNSTLK